MDADARPKPEVVAQAYDQGYADGRRHALVEAAKKAGELVSELRKDAMEERS